MKSYCSKVRPTQRATATVREGPKMKNWFHQQKSESNSNGNGIVYIYKKREACNFLTKCYGITSIEICAVGNSVLSYHVAQVVLWAYGCLVISAKIWMMISFGAVFRPMNKKTTRHDGYGMEIFFFGYLFNTSWKLKHFNNTKWCEIGMQKL